MVTYFYPPPLSLGDPFKGAATSTHMCHHPTAQKEVLQLSLFAVTPMELTPLCPRSPCYIFFIVPEGLCCSFEIHFNSFLFLFNFYYIFVY